MSELDLAFVEQAVAQHGRERGALIPLLQAFQSRWGYLPQEALERLCEVSDITPADVAGVSTFYDQFRHEPVGQHMISVCCGTACHVKGSGAVLDAFRRHLKLADGQDTDERKLFTIQKVACLGCCTLAPAVQIDRVTYGHLRPELAQRVLQDFLELQKSKERISKKQRHSTRLSGMQAQNRKGAESLRPEIRIGLGSCCQARGSDLVRHAIEQQIDRWGLEVRLTSVGCVGMCHQTPLVEIVLPDREPALYARVQAADVPEILGRHFKARGLLRRAVRAASRALDAVLADKVLEPEPLERYMIDRRDEPVEAFLGPQRHLATEHCGRVDPLDFDKYVALGGLQALAQARELGPDRIVEQITASGLAGRGGAGFATGAKWAAVRLAAGEPKYAICNGDEGDPGAFMDRMLLESYPFRVLEGLAIAGLAVGASEAILYIRAEYPLAVQRVQAAIEILRSRDVLGPLTMRIMQGAGAFVCGEETALIASLEGRRGMPRLRPPYPAVSGLWGKPTLVNNVETLALVPWIIRSGPERFSELGTQASKGTKVFALAGKVVRGGLVEVPMGVTIRQIVQDIGGGVAGGKALKAVQIGGPSGGCIAAEHCDVPIDYQALRAGGAIMGSGGLVVLDQDDCMVDIARYFLQFTQNQSCGRCTFCRVGTRRMLDILDALCEGRARAGDLERLDRLARQVQLGSLCGLGKTAPNPVLTTLRQFRSEYEAHLHGRCPAGRCKALVRYVVAQDCIGCTICAQSCPVGAIAMRPYQRHSVDDAKCTRCGVCAAACPRRNILTTETTENR